MLRINFQLKNNVNLSFLSKILPKDLLGGSVKVQRFISERLAIEKYFSIPATVKLSKLAENPLFELAYAKMEDKEKSLFNIWQLSIRVSSAIDSNLIKKIEARLKEHSLGINFICPERTYELSYTPDDPLFPNNQQSLVKINCETAWNTTKGQGIKVAVVDSGTTLNHLDIDDNLLQAQVGTQLIDGRAFLNGAILDDVEDLIGHGTHMSGIIAAEADNFRGIAGVAPEAKTLPIKAFNNLGTARSLDLSRAIYFAEYQGVHIINNSWFYKGDANIVETIDEHEDFSLLGIIQFVMDKNVICVFAAGNGGLNISSHWLVNHHDIIVVAATTINDTKLGVSNWSNNITIAAPGDNITSLGIDGVSYPQETGTSPAAAHVSGALALYLARHGGQRMNPGSVVPILQDSAYSDSIRVPRVGGYRLNCAKLVH